jgi:adenine-specific DNA-methyltransferase
MPKLHWIGKDKVVHHHRDVPYRALDLKYRFAAPEGTPANSSGNHIIHGDNLDALKSLIPEFEGKINCIYIDPPYNTGNEGWVYNDAVNDPKMQKWLGKVVGKEGEDLTRHDKWLCMMYPRLKLLHRLLAKDGVIFVSIDDNEQAHLKLVMDEIFGARLFVANFIWKKKGTTSNVDGAEVSSLFDNTLCYKKTTTAKITARTYSSSEREYPYADELGAYRMTVIEKKSDGEYERKTMMFDVVKYFQTPRSVFLLPFLVHK